jgi:hypothetical protein
VLIAFFLMNTIVIVITVTILVLVRLCPLDFPPGLSGGQIVRLEFHRNSDRTMTGKIALFSPEKFDFWRYRCPVQSGRSPDGKPGGV